MGYAPGVQTPLTPDVLDGGDALQPSLAIAVLVFQPCTRNFLDTRVSFLVQSIYKFEN
jgi:hypothetical protein